MLANASAIIYGTLEDRYRSEKTGYSHSPCIIANPINGIDLRINEEVYSSDVSGNNFVPPDFPFNYVSDKVVTFFGRLNRKKGVIELFEAFLLARKMYPDLKLLLLALEDDKALEESLRIRITSENLISSVFCALIFLDVKPNTC